MSKAFDGGLQPDARWLKDYRDKINEHGAASTLARELGVSQSALTNLKKKGKGSPALILAVSGRLGIRPPDWARAAAEEDELAVRWKEKLARLRRAGASIERIEEFMTELDRIAGELEDLRAKRAEIEAAEKTIWGRRRNETRSPKPSKTKH